jgi:quercetin dioxygenase-like cupin family protein
MSNSTAAVLYRWSDLPADHPMAKVERRRVIGSAMMVSQVKLDKGFRVPTHAHFNEQITIMVSGALKFGIGADGSRERRELVVRAGEVLHLPSNVPHSAEALEDSLVLDLFSPPSEKTGVDHASGGAASVTTASRPH